MSSANQCNHSNAICQELINPDPRIRDARALQLGFSLDVRSMTMELLSISDAILCDGLTLGDHTISLLEDAIYRIQETVTHMPHGAIREALLHLCASCLHSIVGWLEQHGTSPVWPEEPGITDSPSWWKSDASPTLQLNRPRAEIKTRVMSAMGAVSVGGVR